MDKISQKIVNALEIRRKNGLLRQLHSNDYAVDFITNDYLGFSKFIHLDDSTEVNSPAASRLLGGNYKAIDELEENIAKFHGFEAALFYNSGYTANLGLFSCLTNRHDTVIYDEYIHASIRDGIRLNNSKNYSFNHNSLNDLEQKLKISKGIKVVVTEAVFSMHGDFSPLLEMVELCEKYDANLIVDEAHSIAVFGKNGKGRVNELGINADVFAVIYTYGKGMGAHGGTVAGSKLLKEYLINFSRSFIYTTAPSIHMVNAVITSYHLLQSEQFEKKRQSLKKNINFFAEEYGRLFNHPIQNNTPIMQFRQGSIEKTIDIANKLRLENFNVKAILSPTVKEGEESIRVNLHAYNTIQQIAEFLKLYHHLLSK